MALSDLQVFVEYARSAASEMLAFNVDLFNQATRGGIVLRSAAHQGDFSDIAIWAKISGLVRRRDAYGTDPVEEKVLTQLLDTSVKVAAGSPPVRIDPGMLRWIQQDEAVAGATIGQQLAKDTLGDMLSTGLLGYVAAVAGEGTNYYDATGVGDGTATLAILNTGRSKLGDRADDMACWVMHSKQRFDIFGKALAGTSYLFNFGNVKVTDDGFGNPLVVTDSSSLVLAGSPNNYYAGGIVPAGVMVDQNSDFVDNVSTLNGKENIVRSYQAEWSYNLGLKGFQWDKASGGKSPNDAAIATAANWDAYATSTKDLAGVLVKTK